MQDGQSVSKGGVSFKLDVEDSGADISATVHLTIPRSSQTPVPGAEDADSLLSSVDAMPVDTKGIKEADASCSSPIMTISANESACDRVRIGFIV
jgi:hypothetical protein